MKHLIPIILLCSLIMCGCGENQKKSSSLPVIDLNAQYPKKDIVLQEIADVEYISLNGKDAPLMGSVKIGYISNDLYILYDQKIGDVFVIEKNGTVRSYFNQQGNGAKEYQRLEHLTYDKNKREIYIVDISGPNGIIVYSEEGKYIRNFPEHARQYIREIYDFDEETLLAYFQPLRHDPDNINCITPFVFLSKQNGEIITRLPLDFPERIYSRMIIDIEGLGPLGITFGTINNRKYEDDFFIAEISSDTLYTLSANRRLIPVFTRTPSVHDKKLITLSVGLKTDKFLYMYSHEYDIEAIKEAAIKSQPTPQGKSENYLYYLSNHEIIIPKIIDSNRPTKNTKIGMVNVSMAEKNMSADIYQAEQLVKELEKRELAGKLKDVAQRLKADDNPVLMLIRYK